MWPKLTGVLAALGIVLIGCGGSGKNGQKTVSVSIPGSYKVEVTIDANGGEVVVQDRGSTVYGARLKVDVGALNVPTNITLEEGPVGGDVRGERPLRFGPAGTTFAKPVSVTAPFSDAFIQEYEVDLQEMILVLDNGGDTVEIIQPTTIDPIGRTVSGETHHFSIFNPLDYRTLLLFRDPYAFLDGAPIPVTLLLPSTGGGVAVPLVARSSPQVTIVMGKGSLADIGKPGKRTIILVPGLTAPPTTFYYDEQGKKENHNDFSWLFRNDPAFSGMYDNVIAFKYPSGKPVEEVARHFAALIRRFVPQGSLVDILSHSLGCIIVRQAIQVEDISPYVKNVFFLAGPHEGGELNKPITFLTRNRLTGLFVKGAIPSGEQVTIGSTFLADLKTSFLAKHISTSNFFVVESKTDELVPRWSANPSYFNLSPSQVLTLETESHWGIHGNAKINSVAVWIREKVKGQPNAIPAANAGQDQTVIVNTQVTLTGSATDADPDETLTYAWRQTQGPQQVTLANANTATTATFTPTQIGTYTFTLTASDSLATGTDTVTITVNPPPFSTATVTLVGDAYTYYPNPMINFGKGSSLYVGFDGISMSNDVYAAYLLFEFDSAVPTGATIVSATLQLSGVGGVSLVDVYSVATNWDEQTIAWSNAPPSLAANKVGSLTAQRSVDLTSYFQTNGSNGYAVGTRIAFSLQSVSMRTLFDARERGAATASTLTLNWK